MLARMDSAGAPPNAMMRTFPRAGPEHFQSARYHLAVGDTAAAEARLAEIEQVFNDPRFPFSISLMLAGPPAWLGNAWLLAGDLAAARRRLPDAARMYRRVIGLWDGGDPDVQPVVGEARAKLASLSAR